MNKNISWRNLLLIAFVCIILEYALEDKLDGVISGGLGIIGLISLVSGIAGYIKYRKSLKILNENK
jgi:hypothetical protein